MLDRILGLINKRQRQLFERNNRLEDQLHAAEKELRALRKAATEITTAADASFVVILGAVSRSDGTAIKVTCDAIQPRLKEFQRKVRELETF